MVERLRSESGRFGHPYGHGLALAEIFLFWFGF
jgi:hypothetical protein